MKRKVIRDELRQLAKEQLEIKVDELRRELLILRLQSATNPTKNFASKKLSLRKSIACGLTLLNQV